MLIKEKIGQLTSFPVDGRLVDVLELEWHEASKRILRRHTRGGVEVAWQFLREGPALTEGDVLYADAERLIVVEIRACEVLVIRPGSFFKMAAICYEIGNRHVPLFYEEGELLVPYELPLFRVLESAGYAVAKAGRKLLHPLKTTVAMHVPLVLTSGI